jgi:hypothetical protein
MNDLRVLLEETDGLLPNSHKRSRSNFEEEHITSQPRHRQVVPNYRIRQVAPEEESKGPERSSSPGIPRARLRRIVESNRQSLSRMSKEKNE